MTKKKSSSGKLSSYHHGKWMKLLAGFGAAISLIFYVVGIILTVPNPDALLWAIIFGVLGIVVDIILLGSLGLIHHKFTLKMTWLSLLALGIADALCRYFAQLGGNIAGYGYIGVLMIVIAAFIGIFDRL
jgi:hypothetical protein